MELILLHPCFSTHEQTFHGQQLKAQNTNAQSPDNKVLKGLFFLAGLCLLDEAEVYKMSILQPQTKNQKATLLPLTLYTRKIEIKKKMFGRGAAFILLQNKHLLAF